MLCAPQLLKLSFNRFQPPIHRLLLRVQHILVSCQDSYIALQISNPFGIAKGASYTDGQYIGSVSVRALGLAPRVEKF